MSSIEPNKSNPAIKSEEGKSVTPSQRPLDHKVDEVANQIFEKKGRDEVVIPQKKIKLTNQGVSESTQLVADALKSLSKDKIELFKSMLSPKYREMKTDFQGRIGEILTHMSKIKSMYEEVLKESPRTTMQKEVEEMLKSGSMVPEKGGKGGVYYLQDKNGRRRFVLKPLDESNLAVNNGKKNGSICFESGEGAPANGVHIYESVQNAELAYKVAEFLGFSEITPESEVMILEDDRFHDNLHHLLGEKTPKEKVVLVQRYVEGCWDIGTLLCDKTKMQEEEIKNLMKNEEGIKKLESLKEEYMPKDFDQDLYEKLAIFLIVIGEKDGNAGNFIANKEEPKKGEKRTIVKIDNSACFAENNEDIATGLEWFTHNYEQQLSEKTKDLIKNLATKESVEQIKKMMESRGKSAESIKAFEKRIENLEFNSLMCDTPADFDLVFTD